jgi:MraZ protein
MLTQPETPDGQGRMQIPASLRELAGITNQVLIIGTFQRIELWDPKIFERFESGDGDLTLGMPNLDWKYDLEKVLLGDRG